MTSPPNYQDNGIMANLPIINVDNLIILLIKSAFCAKYYTAYEGKQKFELV